VRKLPTTEAEARQVAREAVIAGLIGGGAVALLMAVAFLVSTPEVRFALSPFALLAVACVLLALVSSGGKIIIRRAPSHGDAVENPLPRLRGR